MADLSRISQVSLASLATVNEDSVVIPNGNIVVIRKFGFADVNNGDNKSTIFVLKFGVVGNFETIRIGSATGACQELWVNKSFPGDGVKFFRMTIVNGSVLSKTVAYWLDLFK